MTECKIAFIETFTGPAKSSPSDCSLLPDSQIDAIRKVLDDAKAHSGLGSDDPSVAALEQIMENKIAALAKSPIADDLTPPPTDAALLSPIPEDAGSVSAGSLQASAAQVVK